MTAPDPKRVLHRYLRTAREAMLWKLDGLSEYDIRRPMTPTGTNLLGLVKHLSCAEGAYFGAVFGRPFPEPLPWDDEDAEPNTDMWATANESREQIVGLYRRARAHADDTIRALELDAVGLVPHWPPDRREVTLHTILVHVGTETHRHAGHADIVRELIDGAVGLRAGNGNLPPGDRTGGRSTSTGSSGSPARRAAVPVRPPDEPCVRLTYYRRRSNLRPNVRRMPSQERRIRRTPGRTLAGQQWSSWD